MNTDTLAKGLFVTAIGLEILSAFIWYKANLAHDLAHVIVTVLFR